MPDPADDRPLPGEDSRLYRIGVMLLNGYGYNWYRLDNQMRADDLLVRSRASEHLESAAAQLRDLEGRYRRKYLPPPTREHPDPDPQHLAAARNSAPSQTGSSRSIPGCEALLYPPTTRSGCASAASSKPCGGSGNAMFSWWPTPRS